MPRSAAFLVLLLAGCLEPRDVIILMDERFEDPLDEWSIVGDADTASTIHPGEHALFFYGPTVMDRGIAVTLYDEYQDGNWIEYTSNCGDAPTVRIAQRLDLSWQIVLELPRYGEVIEPERIISTVPPIQRAPYTQASYGQLTVEGDAGCWIDNLRLLQPQPDDGW